MYLLDDILDAFFSVIGGAEMFFFLLSLAVVATISAALVRPFIGDV